MIIKNGRIHVGNGEVLENHDLIISDGVIQQIGQNLESKDSEVIEAEGKEVFPGFIDPLSSYGCMDLTFNVKDHDELSNPINPDLKIKYAFNHSEMMLEELYKVGVTTVGAAPGNRNIISGQMAVYKTWGLNSKKMLVREPVGLKGSATITVKEAYGKREVFPMTRMGIFSELDKFLTEATMKMKNEQHGYLSHIVLKILKRELPFFVNVNNTSEINAIINIAKKHDLKLVICGGYQADRVLESIKEANTSIILGEQTYLTSKNYNNTNLYKIAQLQKEDIPVSFTMTGNYGPEGKLKYLWNAIEFFKAGVESQEVLKMMTMNPAKILGIDDILGTIEVGKHADIAIYSSNPIEYYDARVIHTIIDGKVIYSRGGDADATN